MSEGPAGVPVAATPRLRARLARAADGPLSVLHRGPRAVYLAMGPPAHPWCVGVLSARAVAVPFGLRTALPDLTGLDLTDPCIVSGVLHLGGRPLPIGRLVEAHVPRLAVPATGGQEAAVVAGIGRGDGLTPYGDDVASGWLATRVAAGLPVPAREVRAAARRTTLVGASLLDCALHGEVVPALAAWLAARGAPAEESAAQAALLRVGASSGRGLLEGAGLALDARAVAA